MPSALFSPKQLMTAVLFAAALAFFLQPASSEALESNLIWWRANSSGITAVLDSNFSPNVNDSKALTITVLQGNALVEGADINGFFVNPDNSVESFSFGEIGNGIYQYNYIFLQNGICSFGANIKDSSNNTATISDYFNAGTYAVTAAAISGNNSSYDAGEAISLQFYLSSNSRPLKRASGSISILYPSGGTFASGNFSESATPGYYYHNLTAPSASGTYSFNAAFNSGTNSKQFGGNFTVRESNTGGNTGGNGNGGGGGSSSGSGGSGIIPLPAEKVLQTITETYLPSSDELIEATGEAGLNESQAMQALIILPDLSLERTVRVLERLDAKTGKKGLATEVSIAVINETSQKFTKASIVEIVPKSFAETAAEIESQQAFRTIKEDPVIEFTAASILPGRNETASYSVKKELDAKEIIKEFKPPIVLGSSEAKELRILELSISKDAIPGKQTQAKIKIGNGSAKKISFLLSGTITQGKEIELAVNQFVLDLNPGEVREVELSEPWTPTYGGTYIAELKAMSLDSKTVFDSFTKAFDIQGEFKYDIKIDCLQKTAASTEKASSSIRLLNLGSYYKDIKLSYWIEGLGKQFGKASLPLALYSGEQRSLLMDVDIPQDAGPGEYYFKAMVQYADEKTEEAQCSFTVVQKAFISVQQLAMLFLIFAAIILITLWFRKGMPARRDSEKEKAGFGKLQEKESKEKGKFTSRAIDKIIGLGDD